MKSMKPLLACLVSAAALVACGGGDDSVSFSSMVSFGDSLSDAGTYKVGTVAQLGGGKFTINGPEGKVWTDYLAEAVGQAAPCAARTGMLPNRPGITGAPVADIAACTNYAQGSSRVTSSGTGPNGVGLQVYGQQNLGFMADSLKDQMTRHLAKIGGAYKGSEFITVNAGGNDLFMQLYAVSSAAGGGQAAAVGATIAGWSPATVTAVTAGGANAVNAAATAAVTAMGQAGAELAGYLKTLVVAKGAQYLVVRNLSDVNLTPGGRTLDAGTQGLITNMTQAFNGQLASGLNGTAGVVLLDDYAQAAAVAANPTSFGYSNAIGVACGNNAFGGSSIVCNTTNLIAGNTSAYAFADDSHPTPFAHQKEAVIALDAMAKVGWR
ncbi:MAG: SGNH/GDSL hydrolase family protein [Burkholderiaceae bacterium]